MRNISGLADHKQTTASKGPTRSRHIEGEDEGICYFYGNPRGPIKIGSTQQPAARLRHLRYSTGSMVGKFLAEATGGARQEREYHERFREHHIKGDWFSRSEERRVGQERVSTCRYRGSAYH